jgi:Protein tyrosine and serine/threonine kinase
LGEGGFGGVYGGTFKGSDVAIKKVQIDHLDPNRAPREYDDMLHLDHPNVLKLLHWQDKEEFRFTSS